MQALKTPLFLRPTSRPASPAPSSPSRPDSGIVLERSRPLAKLSSLGKLRRSSPAPTPSGSPAPVLLVQDGSYLEMLSLKLSEAVSKALAPPSGSVIASAELVAGRRMLPNGRGRALGTLIAGELNAAQDNQHLYRAIVRSLQRPLSVLLSNLSSYLLPLISAPAFSSPPAPTIAQPTPNATQLHAAAIASLAGELLETFDDFALGIDADIRGDGLKVIREGLASIVHRVVGPLINGIKNELMPLLESLETPNTVKTPQGTKIMISGGVHPSVVTLQTMVPIYARAVGRYVGSSMAETVLASFLISVVWRGLVALSHRPFPGVTPPPSPALTALNGKKGLTLPTTTPPVTPPSGKFIIKLPSSRPPSPRDNSLLSPTALDARVLYNTLSQFQRPSISREATRLASEAVEEAFRGLNALAPLIDVVPTLNQKLGASHDVDGLVTELEQLTSELPSLTALPILLKAYGNGTLAVSGILGIPDAEYRNSCLATFGRADECAGLVCRRVLNSLNQDQEIGMLLAEWLDGEIEEAGSSQ